MFLCAAFLCSNKYTLCLKNVPPLVCYNFDTRECILIFFGRNVTDKVSNQKALYCATSNNVCFCTTLQNGETRKSHFFHSNAVSVHCQNSTSRSLIISVCLTPDSAVWLPKSCNQRVELGVGAGMCLIASNICWYSKIFHSCCPLTFTPGLTKNNSHLLHSDRHRDRTGKHRVCG